MTEMVDASTLADEARVRRGQLAEAHENARRKVAKGEPKAEEELAEVLKEIEAEYASDEPAGPKPKAGGK